MIPEYALNIIAGVFLASAQSIYSIQVLKKQITPSILTWAGWSILVSVALISQLVEFGWDWALTGHLFSAFGCTFIFISVLVTKNFDFLPKDLRFLFWGLGCVILYALFSDPWSTTIFAILADGILGMPTIKKAIKSPKTEKSIGWNIALGCWTLTLATCMNKNVLFLMFPAYCFLFNAVMSYLTSRKRIVRMEAQFTVSHRTELGNHLKI